MPTAENFNHKMNKLIVAMLVLSALSGCENIYSPKNINLSCICIESESTACSYDNQEVIVDFKKNIMTFRDNSYKSVITGSMAPIHHTPWKDAMDDTIESYLLN